jgi:hypothetical protein
VPLLAAAAGQHASLSGAHAAATMRSASGLARAPPLAALIAIQAGDASRLGAAGGQLSLANLSRLLSALVSGAATGRLPPRARRGPPAERASAQPAASGRWALAAVVCSTAARRARGARTRRVRSCVPY